MKKQMFIYFFIFFMSVFYLSVPNVVLGQGHAQNVFGKYKKNLFQRAEIRQLLPDVLDIFIETEGLQEDLTPIAMDLILRNPQRLKAYDSEINERFLQLLTTDSDLRDLFGNEEFYNVLKNTNEVKELKKKLNDPLPTSLIKKNGNNVDKQSGESNEELENPFVVQVLDQNGEPIDSGDLQIIFKVDKDQDAKFSVSGEKEKTVNIVDGQAEITLTLGSALGIYQVEASVVGHPELKVTFTAAAVTTEPDEVPVPVPTELTIVLGNDQYGEAGKRLAQPFVVGVLNKKGDPLADISVTFNVIEGDGQISPNTATTEGVRTNKYGQASVDLTLGLGAGINRIRASIRGTTLQETFIAVATTSLPVVYWIEDGRIFRLDGSVPKPLITPSAGWIATSLAVDIARNKLYWTERRIEKNRNKIQGKIQSANLNDKKPIELKLTQAVPEGIVVDAENGWLYWTNSRGKIQTINVNGRNFNGDLITGLGSPKHIALGLDAATTFGTLYWTAYNETSERWSIWCQRLGRNGSVTKKEIVMDLGELSGIAVDREKLYWTEEVSENQGKISSSSLNGSGDKTFSYVPGSVPLGLAVDEVGRRLYWTDAGGNIQSLDLDEPKEIVTRGSGKSAVAIAVGRPSVGAAPVLPAAPSTIVERSEQNILLANYPNPFNPETWIPYNLAEPADVTVSIYSVNGHLIRTLALGHQAAGVYRNRSRAAYWDGRNELGERVASGLYFYTLTAGDFTATRKMLIRK